MESNVKHTESNEFDRDMELYTQFVSVQHLAEQFKLDTNQLLERLEKGCSLPVALLVPSDLDIQVVRHYPKRETHCHGEVDERRHPL